MYSDVNDYELLDMISDNEIATETLYEKYKPLIVNLALKTYKKNKIVGLDPNDLIQEGMIGFSIALNTFNDKKDTSFYTFARLCIIRRILSFVISTNRQKFQLLNESISVEKISEGSMFQENVFADNKNNPENVLLSDENVKELIKKIESELTSFECEVFELKTAGFNIKEIGEILEKDKKSIYNAIDRIKTKLKKYKKQK